MQTHFRIGAFACLAMLWLGCNETQPPPLDVHSPVGCTPGHVRDCRCDDGRLSNAICRQDGAFYVRCACGVDEPPRADAQRPPPRLDARTPQPTRDASPPPPRRDAAPPEDAARPPDAAPIDAAPPELDAAPPEPDAALDPARCPAPPDAVQIGGVRIFRYEASHPLATPGAAFPGARSRGQIQPAPEGPTEACSRFGVRPWHSVTWAEADQACREIGWRLCTGAELRRACGGAGDLLWTWGPEFIAGQCNLREGYVARGQEFASEAPSGAFPGCESPDGVFDLVGNLWEWTDNSQLFQGAGWRTIAERHRDGDLTCRVQNQLADNTEYANPDVGFRCCQAAR